MTAAEILRSYQAGCCLNLRSTAWLQLLLIASHGPEGCRALSLARGPLRNKQGIRKHTFERWQAKGLVTLERRRTRPNTNPALWVTITPAALAVLRVSQ